MHHSLETEEKRIGGLHANHMAREQGNGGPQRNIKVLYRRKAIGQRVFTTETQGNCAAAAGDTVTVLNYHLVCPHPTPRRVLSPISHSDFLVAEEQRGVCRPQDQTAWMQILNGTF